MPIMIALLALNFAFATPSDKELEEAIYQAIGKKPKFLFDCFNASPIATLQKPPYITLPEVKSHKLRNGGTVWICDTRGTQVFVYFSPKNNHTVSHSESFGSTGEGPVGFDVYPYQIEPLDNGYKVSTIKVINGHYIPTIRAEYECSVNTKKCEVIKKYCAIPKQEGPKGYAIKKLKKWAAGNSILPEEKILYEAYYDAFVGHKDSKDFFAKPPKTFYYDYDGFFKDLHAMMAQSLADLKSAGCF